MKPTQGHIALFTPSGCLSLDAMQRSAVGRLSIEEAASVKVHLQECPFCKEAFDGVIRMKNIDSLPQKVSEIKRQMRPMFGGGLHISPLYYAAAASIALVVVVSLVIMNPFWKNDLAINTGAKQEAIPSLPVPEKETEEKGQTASVTTDTIMMPVVTSANASDADKSIVVLANNAETVKSKSVAVADEELAESASLKADRSAAGGGSGVSGPLASTRSYGSTASVSRAKKSVAAERVYRSNQYDDMYSEAMTVVEEAPKFAGGKKGLNKYISTHTKYPEKAMEQKIEGKVYVQFIVDSDGTIKNAHVIQGVDPLIDDEAVRVINSLPKWIPGTMMGKPVKVWFILPVEFKIHQE